MKKIIVAAVMCVCFVGTKSICMSSQDLYRQQQAAEQQRRQEERARQQAAIEHAQRTGSTAALTGAGVSHSAYNQGAYNRPQDGSR